MFEKVKKDFMSLNSDENKVFALIELSKKATGQLPSVNELNEGLETLGVTPTDELKAKIKNTFNIEL